MTTSNHTLTTDATSIELTVRMVPGSGADEALAIWRSLEARLADDSVASGATWTGSWIEVYGDLVPHHFLIAEAGGVVRGICLITNGVKQKDGPWTVQTRHLGTAGEPLSGSVCVEYNRLLVESCYRDSFISQIVTTLQQDHHWEHFRLDGFSLEDLEPWKAHFPSAQIRSRDSKYFDLAAAREAGTGVLDQLGRSTRSNLRRRLKQYGELDCQWATTLAQAEEIFHELVQLHQARWQAVGQPGAFASERFLKFQSTAAFKLFLEDRAVFFRVRHQNETVGCLLLLVDRNRLLDYLSGFASFEDKPSPGLTTHYLCMQAALERGFSAYDFLVGETQHKNNLSNAVNQLCWLTWSRSSWKQKTIDQMRLWKQWFQWAGSIGGNPLR